MPFRVFCLLQLIILAGSASAVSPTGIDYDRAIPVSAFERYDGSAEAPPVTVAQWLRMCSGMTRASSAPADRPDVSTFREAAWAAVASGIVPLAVMDVVYPTSASSPSRTDRVFAATALRPHTYRGESVEFVLRRDLLVVNGSEEPTRVTVDFDDGAGPRPLAFDQLQVIRYAVEGDKILRLTWAKSDGSVLRATISFEVIALATVEPDLTLDITASISYLGTNGTGTAYCYLGAGNTSLVDPVIVVEGFDPANSHDRDWLYSRLNNEDLLGELGTDGYDAIVLDFGNGSDYIQRNAMVLVELIQQVNDRIPHGQDLVVIGASMGGLVSRYALAYMEHNGLEHNVRTFISFDSPQNLANIPIGIQGLIKWATEETLGAGRSLAEEKLAQLRTPAAKQMLGLHIDASAYGEHPDRQQLYTDLDILGSYPQELRKVAIANGSGTMAHQGFEDSDRLLHFETSGPNILYLGCYALPGRPVFRVEILGFNTDITTVPAGVTSWDRAPGGFRNTAEQAVFGIDFTIDMPWPVDDIDASVEIVADEPNHCFIPTISALDLATPDPLFDIAGTAPSTLLSMTPFDAVYYPDENQDHVSITAENKVWFMDEIRRQGPSGVADRPSVLVARPELREIYPNPFNPQTTITFDLPRAAVAMVEIVDVAGRRVATLVDGFQPAGAQSVVWTGTDQQGRDVATGIYFCRLSVGETLAVQRMALVR